MFAGYMRSKEKPGHMAKLLAIMCKYEGIELVYFTPNDVSLNTGKVTGKVLINKQWMKVETTLPGFIDINPNYFNKNKYIDLIKYLNSNSILSADKRMPLPKDKLQEVFQEDKEISKYLIPSKKIETMKDIEEFINKYDTVILKPILSNRGRNIYIIKKSGANYWLGLNKEGKEINKSELKDLYEETIKDKGFVVQKCIMSRNSQNDPFDCRVHVEKNGKGKWDNVKNFIRIGVGQTVISNVSQGGGISELKKFLKATYNDDWEPIYKEVKKLAHILPYKVEEVLGREYMNFGFDVGIDKDGSLYLFEVNDFPIVSPMKSEIAMARAGYYRYMLEREN